MRDYNVIEQLIENYRFFFRTLRGRRTEAVEMAPNARRRRPCRRRRWQVNWCRRLRRLTGARRSAFLMPVRVNYKSCLSWATRRPLLASSLTGSSTWPAWHKSRSWRRAVCSATTRICSNPKTSNTVTWLTRHPTTCCRLIQPLPASSTAERAAPIPSTPLPSITTRLITSAITSSHSSNEPWAGEKVFFSSPFHNGEKTTTTDSLLLPPPSFFLLLWLLYTLFYVITCFFPLLPPFFLFWRRKIPSPYMLIIHIASL